MSQPLNDEKNPLRPSQNEQPLSELPTEPQIMDKSGINPALERRFQQMVPLDKWTAITNEPICWREYQQFLDAQNTSQPHPIDQAQTALSHPLDLPVVGLSTLEQLGFCVWISTQITQRSNGALFDYNPPGSKDLEKVGLHGTHKFYILRHTIDLKFSKLVNNLANALWREADQETYRLMITTLGKEEGQPFTLSDLQTFPCKDLLILDRLWVKYSKGKWGFSVQKQIWEKCGSSTESNNDWTKFCSSVGWNNQGIGMDDGKPILDPNSSPQGKLPLYGWLWKKAGLRRLGLFIRQDF